MVGDAVWAEAGMEGRESGFLCTPCLRARLGRDLTVADYLCRPVRATSKYIEVQPTPEYLVSIDAPEH